MINIFIFDLSGSPNANMKYFVALLLLISFIETIHAQDTAKVVSQKLSTRDRPRYPGGENELRKFLALNLRYPNDAINNNIEGEVIVSFKIDADGKVSEVTSLKSLGYGCDEEAIRVVNRMPNWEPARKGGKKVAVMYNLPIVFELPKQKQ
jgi:TonB family protein